MRARRPRNLKSAKNGTYSFAEILRISVNVTNDATLGAGRAKVLALNPVELGAPVSYASQVVLARVEPGVAFRRAQRHIPEPFLPRYPLCILQRSNQQKIINKCIERFIFKYISSSSYEFDPRTQVGRALVKAEVFSEELHALCRHLTLTVA